MPARHDTEIFDVNDFHIWPMTLDSVGASPVYGAAIDVPGIQEVGIDPNFVSSVLKGDARTLRRKAKIDEIQMTANYAMLSLDANAGFYGGVVTDNPDSESGSSEVARWRYFAGSQAPYFKAQFVMEDIDPDLDGLVVVLYKCQVTGGTLLHPKSDDWGSPTVNFSAIQPDHPLTPTIDIVLYETLPDDIASLVT